MAREFVSEGELINMAMQLKSMAPMVLSRWASHSIAAYVPSVRPSMAHDTASYRISQLRLEITSCLVLQVYDTRVGDSVLQVDQL